MNLSVESICETNVAVTAVFNEPPSFDFNVVETVRIFFVNADSVGLITSMLSFFSKDVIKLIYGKYIAELQITENMVHQIDPKFNFRRLYQKETSGSDIKALFNSYLTILKRRIKKRYNVFSPK